ncbi:MAG: hypothetical protein H6Q75_745 [Firmicutes bacterium]|nr:hypothetical protein [Bacillota bacterium]
MRPKLIAIILVIFIFGGIASCYWYGQSQTVMAQVKGALSEELAKDLGSHVSIGDIRIVSYNTLVLEEVKLSDDSGLIGESKSITVTIKPLAIVTGEVSAAAIGQVNMEGATIHLVQQADGAWNFDDIVVTITSRKAEFAGKISLDKAMITVTTPQGSWGLEQVTGEADFGRSAAVVLDAQAIYSGAPVKVAGAISRNGRSTVEIRMNQLDLAVLKPFMPEKIKSDNFGGQLADIKTTVRCEQGKITYSGEAVLSQGAFDLEGTPVREMQGNIAFTDKSLTLAAVSAKVKEQPLAVSGEINFSNIVPEVSLNVTSDSFDSRVLGESDFSGVVSFSAVVNGSVEHLVAGGQITVPEGMLGEYPVRQGQVQFVYQDNTITINQAQATMFGGLVSATGQVGIIGNTFSFTINGQGLDVAALPIDMQGLTGTGAFTVSVEGTGNLADANLTGKVSVDNGSVYGTAFKQMTGSISKTSGTIALECIQLDFDPGIFFAKGVVENGKVAVDFVGQGIPLAKVLAPAKGLAVEGAADCEGRVSGSLSDLKLAGHISAYNGQIFSQPFSVLNGDLTVDKEKITVIKLIAVQDDARQQLDGSIGLAGEHELNLTVTTKKLRAENVIKLLAPGERITGNIDSQMRITGTAADPCIDGQITLYEGSFRGQLVNRVQGTFRRQNNTIVLNNFEVEALNAKAAFSGTISAENQFDIDVEAKEVELSALHVNYPYPVSGKLKFTGKLTGTYDGILFHGNMAADNLVLNGQKLEEVNGQIDVAGDEINIPAFSFSQKDGKFSFTGSTNMKTGSLYGNLNTENASVAGLLSMLNLSEKAKNVDGCMNGKVVVWGTMAKPNFWLTGSMVQGKIKNYPLENVDVDVAMENNVITVEKFEAASGKGKLVIKGTAEIDGPLNLEASANDMDAGVLSAWFDTNMIVTGKMGLTAQVSGTWSKPTVGASLAISQGGLENATFDSLYGMFILEDGCIHVDQLMFTKGPNKASVYGTIPLAALNKTGWSQATSADQMDLVVHLDQADLSILPLLTKDVDWAAGKTAGEIRVGGNLTKPLLYGSIVIEKGSVKLSSLADIIQNVGVDIRFEGDTISIKSFSGQMGEGNFRLTGTAALNGLQLDKYNLALMLDKLTVNHKYFKGPVSGALSLVGSEGIPKLSGQIILNNTVANVPFIPEFPESDFNIGLDIEVVAQNKVRLRNSYLYDLWVDGKVKFGGTFKEPVTTGEVTVVRGTVSYLRNQFKVRSGNAEFTQVGSFFPFVNLSAEASLDRTILYLTVTGPLTAMEIKLSSEPELSQQEILSLLTLRSRYFENSKSQTESRDAGLGREELLGILDAGLQMRFLGEAESSFRDYFGLDDFRLVRGTLASETSTASREAAVGEDQQYNIAIGKYVTNRLFLQYWMGVDKNRNGYLLRYDLTKWISLTGEQDELGNHQFGVETRFKF